MSLFGKASAAPASPTAQSSPSIQNHAPTSPPQDSGGLKEQLIAAQDKHALAFIREMTETDPETGAFLVTLSNRVKVFDQITDWLMKREQLVTGSGDDNPEGIKLMQSMLKTSMSRPDDAKIVPKRLTKRRTKAQIAAQVRQEIGHRHGGVGGITYPQDDDSGLQKMFKGTL